MARYLHWQIKFESRNHVDCFIDIYQENYTGEIIQLQGADNAFEFQEDTSKDLLNFVRYKTGYIRIKERDYGELDALYPTTLFSRYVKVYYGRTNCVFSGYIQCQEFESDFSACPRTIELPVISPLGLLESIYFDKPTQDTNVPGFVGLSPGMVTLGSLMRVVMDKLNADYEEVIYPGNTLAPWNCEMLSTICTPLNTDFKHYQSSDSIYTPESLKYFIEGVCSWLGWFVHDTPNAIVFSQYDLPYGSAYSRVTYENLPQSKTAETGHEPTERSLKNFSTLYQWADNNATQSMTPPAKSIAIKAQGGRCEQKVTTSISKTHLYISELRIALMLDILDPQFSATNKTFGPIRNSQGKYNSGTFIYTSDIKSASSSKYVSVMPSNMYEGYVLFGMKFATFAMSRDSVELKCKFTFGRDFDELKSDFDDKRIEVKINGQIINNRAIIGGSNKGELTMFVPDSIWKLTHDNPIEPITVELCIAPSDYNDFEEGDILCLEEMSLYASNDSDLGWGENPRYNDDWTINNENFGLDEKSITVNFQNYLVMACGHSLGTDDRISDSIPSYNYMFRTQRFLSSMFRGKTADTDMVAMYCDKWQNITKESERLTILSESFKLETDEHSFIFVQ